MVEISLCMIVKDEEETLDRCLKSIEGIPDEIIIVDTGSQDKTKEIAKKWTEKVFDFQWIDDFSAARNFSFQKATKDFIMWLDADDILKKEEKQKFLKLKNQLTPQTPIDAISMIYKIDEGINCVNLRRIRLVKKASNFSWVGIVHEDLTKEEEFGVYNSDIIITHKKPLSKINNKNSKRNLEIFEKNIKKGKKLNPDEILNYARELQEHKDYQKAIEYYHKFLEYKGRALGIRMFAYNNLATCYFYLNKEDKVLETTLKALTEDIPHPCFCCKLGDHFLKEKKFKQAIFWYNLATNVEIEESIHKVSFKALNTWIPYRQLGFCYLNLKEYEKALHFYEKCLKYNPNEPHAITAIKELKKVKNLLIKKPTENIEKQKV